MNADTAGPGDGSARTSWTSSTSIGANGMSEHTADRQLRERARAVIPGGMYGHQ